MARALPQARVESAGIGAVQGSAMDPAAAAIAERESLAPIHHVARQLAPNMVREFELILVMEEGQKDWIERRYPQSRGRVFLLSHWQGGDDIDDPFRGSIQMFETIYAELRSCTDDWRQRLST